MKNWSNFPDELHYFIKLVKILSNSGKYYEKMAETMEKSPIFFTLITIKKNELPPVLTYNK